VKTYIGYRPLLWITGLMAVNFLLLVGIPFGFDYWLGAEGATPFTYAAVIYGAVNIGLGMCYEYLVERQEDA